ncbi:hypothetical protein GQ44DRAFT_713277 [Phaeosphaeriaceae sp. PMI808]|nr:hypothetical protein GQ44DRAFT_713277 [Phaeosphaeriaceae sp. PMI808]
MFSSQILKRAPPSNHQIEFMKNIATLFNNTEYSDAVIQIHGVTLHVHLFIICIQCEYFKKAFGGFAEGSTRTIKFDNGSGAAHWRVIEYLYTGNYSNQLSTTELQDDPELLRDIRVHALADMFFIKGLKSLSEVKFRRELADSGANDDFVDCVDEVYASTYEGNQALRSALVEAAIAQRQNPDVYENLKYLSRQGGEFVVDYLEAFGEQVI